MITKLCKCGCGEKFKCNSKSKQRFIYKHSSRGKNNPFYGKKLSAAHRKKISENHANVSGINHPNYGKHLKPETREKIRLANIKIMNDPELRRIRLARRDFSVLEKRFIEFIKDYNLNYDFVGNGTLWLDGKNRRRCGINPDFVHKTLKIVIEVYGTSQKALHYESAEKYEEIRKKRLLLCGYKVIFINEKDLFGGNWQNRCLDKIRDIENAAYTIGK